MAVGDAYVFPGFLTPVLTQLFFPKPPTTFLTCFCRGERHKYAGKKSRLNRGSNSQPPGHESDTLTTEPPGRGFDRVGIIMGKGENVRQYSFSCYPLSWFPIKIQYLTIHFSSVVMVLAFHPGVPGSTHLHFLYICHALFICFFGTDFVRKIPCLPVKIAIFAAFVEGNTTMSSIWYFENHVSYFVRNRRK